MNNERNVRLAQEFYERQERRQKIESRIRWGSLVGITGAALVAVLGRMVGAW